MLSKKIVWEQCGETVREAGLLFIVFGLLDSRINQLTPKELLLTFVFSIALMAAGIIIKSKERT